MARIRHLRNAPITEAIVDFRASLPGDLRPDRLREAKDRLAQRYPEAVERKGLETRLEIAAGRPTERQTRDLGFLGIWLKTEDQKSIAQFRVDGFTFNRLRPYTSWEDIFPEAMRLWAIYLEIASPESVTRVALRYINHMPLPSPGGELSGYIVTGPRWPLSAQEILSSFATKVVLEYPQRNMKANVIQTLEIGVKPSEPSLLFDIDVYRSGDLEASPTALQPIFDELRRYKNEIFFGSLTDRFLEEFE